MVDSDEMVDKMKESCKQAIWRYRDTVHKLRGIGVHQNTNRFPSKRTGSVKKGRTMGYMV